MLNYEIAIPPVDPEIKDVVKRTITLKVGDSESVSADIALDQATVPVSARQGETIHAELTQTDDADNVFAFKPLDLVAADTIPPAQAGELSATLVSETPD